MATRIIPIFFAILPQHTIRLHFSNIAPSSSLGVPWALHMHTPINLSRSRCTLRFWCGLCVQVAIFGYFRTSCLSRPKSRGLSAHSNYFSCAVECHSFVVFNCSIYHATTRGIGKASTRPVCGRCDNLDNAWVEQSVKQSIKWTLPIKSINQSNMSTKTSPPHRHDLLSLPPVRCSK